MKKHLKSIFTISLLGMLLTSCNEFNSTSSSEINPTSDTSEEISYVVTWKNYDGTILEIDENVLKGSSPSYDGEIPLRNEDDKYTYTFNGWSPSLSEVTSDITYTATFKEDLKYYSFVVTSQDTSKGNVSVVGTPNFNNDIVISAFSNEGYDFVGWYDDNNLLVSKDNPYTFKMPNHDYSLIAHFEENEKTKWDINHGVIPTLDEENMQITYGLYPQSKISDSKLIESLNSLTEKSINDWYLFENEYYVKENAHLISDTTSNKKFDDGTDIVEGEKYWFKVEPIKWNIVQKNDSTNEYYLLTSLLLDTQPFNQSNNSKVVDGETIYANNYEHSQIRSWLNDTFFNKAFALNSSYINETLVGNSALSADKDDNPYLCSNTIDKVFLPSYKDLTNEEFGFSSNRYSKDEYRVVKTTDYSRVKGAFAPTKSNSNGCYWTRSPYDTNDGCYIWYSTSDGQIFQQSATWTYLCIRAAINITIDNL